MVTELCKMISEFCGWGHGQEETTLFPSSSDLDINKITGHLTQMETLTTTSLFDSNFWKKIIWITGLRKTTGNIVKYLFNYLVQQMHTKQLMCCHDVIMKCTYFYYAINYHSEACSKNFMHVHLHEVNTLIYTEQAKKFISILVTLIFFEL